jgi:hypothetical protein
LSQEERERKTETETERENVPQIIVVLRW